MEKDKNCNVCGKTPEERKIKYLTKGMCSNCYSKWTWKNKNDMCKMNSKRRQEKLLQMSINNMDLEKELKIMKVIGFFKPISTT